MTRQQAIQKAQYFRIGAVVLEVASGKEETYRGPRVISTAVMVTTIDSKTGKETNVTKYKRSVLDNLPSIALAKKACRTKGRHMVVAEQPGEDLRKIAARRREV
jgi:hypothetical protein